MTIQSKQKRNARRAAARAAAAGGGEGATSVAALAGAQEEPEKQHKVKDEEKQEAMNAKERRLAKRAAQRESLSSSTVAPEDPQKQQPMNAKERRLAKRAAERQSSPAESAATHSAPPGEEEDQKQPMNAKERRLAKRAAAREMSDEHAAAAATDDRKEDKNERKKQRPKGAAPLVVFVGQLSFKTTAEEIEQHFRTVGDIGDSQLTVRLLTKPGERKNGVPPASRGMAFIEVDDPRTLHKCLELHHTRLGGRVINVEKTSGGGKAKVASSIKEGRQKQNDTMKGVVDRIMDNFISQNLLRQGEFDADAIRVLNKFDGGLVEKALMDFIETKDRDELRNPSAYLVHLAHKLAFESDEIAPTDDLKTGVEKQRVRLLGEDSLSKKSKSTPKTGKGGDRDKKRPRSGKHKADSGEKKSRRSEKPQDEEGVSAVSKSPVQGGKGDSVPLHKIFPSLKGRGGCRAASRGSRS